jgi:hypothetical protein
MASGVSVTANVEAITAGGFFVYWFKFNKNILSYKSITILFKICFVRIPADFCPEIIQTTDIIWNIFRARWFFRNY